jgi:hypothetical protein
LAINVGLDEPWTDVIEVTDISRFGEALQASHHRSAPIRPTCTIKEDISNNLLRDNFQYLTAEGSPPKVPEIQKGQGLWAAKSATPAFRPTICMAKPVAPMSNGSDVFTEINNAILDLQGAGLQNYQRPLKKIAQLLHSPDLESANQELASKVNLDEFLAQSRATKRGMSGSENLQWPDDSTLQLGLFLKLMDMFGEAPDKATNFGYEFFYTGSSKVVAGIHALTRDLIIPFTRDFKRYVLSRGQPANRLVIPGTNKVFIVHGHDDAALQGLARFLEKLGLSAIVLKEQPNMGRTIIEKFEDSAGEVGYAVVLMTPDDIGGAVGSDQSVRARQNVLFELGYFAGKLGRGKVCLLKNGAVEIPSDLFGVVYTDMDDAGAWRQSLVGELKAAKLEFDANNLWG